MAEPRTTVRLTIAYDGRSFFGWQRLRGKETVQGVLEGALSEVAGAPVEVRGAGRTDRGTHARGQVATARMPADVDISNLQGALSSRLPAAITVLDVGVAPAGFHPRTSATGKRYVYTIYNAADLPAESEGRVWHVPERLDVQAMQSVLPLFVGHIDFASFASKAGHARASTIRTVSRFSMDVTLPSLVLTIEADGFLYKMVRNIVRAVVRVGEGRWDRSRVRDALEARDRHAAPGSAPASGLCLDEVFYPTTAEGS